MRYAEGDVNAARAALSRAIADPDAGRRDWLLLLDLERITGRWTAYESVAERYRRQFGEEAPTERDRQIRESEWPEFLRHGGSGCVSLGGELGVGSVEAMGAIRSAATRQAVIHLDVLRVEKVDAIGCRLLFSALSDLIDAGNGIVISGAEHLVRLLRDFLARQPAQNSAWDLLLLMRRLARDPAGFDRDSADFALALGIDPPGWEPLLLPQPLPANARERRQQPRYVARDSLSLEGVVSDANDRGILELEGFAAGREYVNVDLSTLDRMTLSAATAFASAVAAAAAQARTVRIIRPNQLVGALLEMLDLGAAASILMPRA